MRGALFGLSLMALGASCSFLNRIDACDGDGPAERTLNRRFDGPQRLTGPGAVVALPGNLAWAGFLSETAVAGAPNEVRVSVVGPDGAVLPGCEQASTQDETWANAPVSYHSLFAAPPSGPNRAGLAVYAHHASADGSVPARLVGQFFRTTGCRFAGPSREPFTIAEPAGQLPILALPSVVPVLGAATDDFVVIWQDLGRGPSARVVREDLGAAFPATALAADGAAVTLPIAFGAVTGLRAVAIEPGRIALVWIDTALQGATGTVLEQQLHVAFIDDRLNVLGKAVTVGGKFAGDVEAPGSNTIEAAWDGRALAVATVHLDGEARRVYFGLLDRDGAALAGGISPDGAPVAISRGEGTAEASPALAPLAGGGFAVSWRERPLGSAQTVPGRLKVVLVGRDGQRIFNDRACGETEFELGGASGGDKRTPALATRPDGALLAAWTQEGGNPGKVEDPSGSSIRGSLFPLAELFPRGQQPAEQGPALRAVPPTYSNDVPVCAVPGSKTAYTRCSCDSDCGAGAVCRTEALTGTPGGYCELRCSGTSSAICGRNAVCERTYCRTRCVTSKDCEAGRLCYTGFCLPNCAADSDCLSGHCDLYSGKCTAGPPPTAGAGLDAPCLRDEDCRSGVCSETCLTPCQLSRSSCPEGGKCIGPAEMGDYGLCYRP